MHMITCGISSQKQQEPKKAQGVASTRGKKEKQQEIQLPVVSGWVCIPVRLPGLKNKDQQRGGGSVAESGVFVSERVSANLKSVPFLT